MDHAKAHELSALENLFLAGTISPEENSRRHQLGQELIARALTCHMEASWLANLEAEALGGGE